jgi:hypothetical protein
MVYVIQFISSQTIYIQVLYFPLLNMSLILFSSLTKVITITSTFYVPWPKMSHYKAQYQSSKTDVMQDFSAKYSVFCHN